jgi:hypothetical protein
VGDILHLQEHNPETAVQWAHSNRHPVIKAEITYMSSAFQQEGYVVLGIKVLNDSNDESSK